MKSRELLGQCQRGCTRGAAPGKKDRAGGRDIKRKQRAKAKEMPHLYQGMDVLRACPSSRCRDQMKRSSQGRNKYSTMYDPSVSNLGLWD